MPSAVFDLGHTGHTGGKPPARYRRLQEHLLVAQYVTHARLYLEHRGWDTAVAGLGLYRDRQALASELGYDFFVACHVNAGAQARLSAGGIPGGAVFYHYASRTGPAAAQSIADELQSPHLRVRTFASRSDDWTRNAFALHRYAVRCVGLVYEPGYLDYAGHAALWTKEGLIRVGESLARGLDRMV